MDRGATIVAPASGQGRAGVAVIRISGPATAAVLRTVAGGIPEARRATLRKFVDPKTAEAIDRGLALWFPGPNSFTGEDMAELHIHGGRSVIEGLLGALVKGCGCRLAEPGEFARRAFANGKLDLAAVEGLSDLIEAETEAQRRQALRQLEGALGRKVEDWAARLLEVMAWAEAALDFSDESDVPARSLASAMESADAVAREMSEALASASQGERLRDGFMVALAGPPNAGKSTLLNALAKRDVAIVSPIPGTTRDAIEVRLDLGGLPITLVDLAGIRDSSDPIESEGIARARQRIQRADLVLWLEEAESTESGRQDGMETAVRVRTKVDLASKVDSGAEPHKRILNLSAVTGEGVDELLKLIRARAMEGLGAGDVLVTRERHRIALGDASAHLNRAIAAFQRGVGEEMVAEDLRLAVRSLGRISGRVDVEDVLGTIFSRFCVGK
ncbi:tRNA uridine-5-carboxymethylaminomethyl(34) synthesis GTPase MnmE [Terrirubrum flagellatum]|uniref:tRNA uridine-5-carboxymethylaminomethyl(34) synthesis GTPase MnmE n=1 Tax=Terrirubrum flagellatum TaxID=2895980 RepID=UPI003CC81654